MSKKWKLISAVIAAYLLMVLLFTALSDSCFLFYAADEGGFHCLSE
jgi:hypothetical protein